MENIFQEIELTDGESSAIINVKLNNFEKKDQYKNSGYKWNPNEKYWYKKYYLNVYNFNSNYPDNSDNNVKKFIDIIKEDKNIDKDILSVFLKQLNKSVQMFPPIKYSCKKQNNIVEINIEKPNLPDKMMKQYGHLWK